MDSLLVKKPPKYYPVPHLLTYLYKVIFNIDLSHELPSLADQLCLLKVSIFVGVQEFVHLRLKRPRPAEYKFDSRPLENELGSYG